MNTIQPQRLTLRDIAHRENVKMHVAKYAIDSADILPVQRVGVIRLWSADQLQEISRAIARTSRKREGAEDLR